MSIDNISEMSSLHHEYQDLQSKAIDVAIKKNYAKALITIIKKDRKNIILNSKQLEGACKLSMDLCVELLKNNVQVKKSRTSTTELILRYTREVMNETHQNKIGTITITDIVESLMTAYDDDKELLEAIKLFNIHEYHDEIVTLFIIKDRHDLASTMIQHSDTLFNPIHAMAAFEYDA